MPGQSANLDFLRAFAVLLVFGGHLLSTFHTDRILGYVTVYQISNTGVVLFFVHTSLVLMFSLERILASGLPLFSTFYIRRAFRIYPLSILTVVIMLTAQIPAFPTREYSWPGWGAVASNLALTQNLTGSTPIPAVLWSLPYEVEMYAVLPLVFLLVHRFRWRWLPVCLWTASVAVLMAGLRHKLVPVSAPCFLGGIIAYRFWGARKSPRGLASWLWPLAIVSCIAVRSVAEAFQARSAMDAAPWFACLFLGLAAPQFKELSSPWLRWLAHQVATFSYGIYLSHSAIFWLAFVVLKEKSLFVESAVCAVLSVLVPIGLYYSIEHPLIQASQRLTRAQTAPSAALFLRPRPAAEGAGV